MVRKLGGTIVRVLPGIMPRQASHAEKRQMSELCFVSTQLAETFHPAATLQPLLFQ